MIYLLAAVGAITVVVLLWRAFGANPAEAVERRPRRAAPIAPDDDPDFLRRLGEKKKKPPKDGDGSQPPT